jgi:hypothetical protein
MRTGVDIIFKTSFERYTRLKTCQSTKSGTSKLTVKFKRTASNSNYKVF